MNFYENKHVLVAGGTGTIGIEIVKQLLLKGCKITVVSLDSKEYFYQIFGEKTPVNFVQADLREFVNCYLITKDVDYIFDMTGIKGSIGSNEGTLHKRFVSYLRFQANLMDAAYKNSVKRYLYAGSICSYPAASTPKAESLMWEGLPLQNDKYAGIAKRVGEAQAMTYIEDGVWDAVRIVRFPNVYGPNDDFNPATAQVIPALIARIEAGENPLKVWGDGSQIRDFLYVDDAAFWSIKALEVLPPGLPTNLGGVHVYSIRHIVEELCRIYPDLKVEFDPSKQSGDPIRVLDNSRAKQIMDFTELNTLNTALRSTIKWYRENRNIAAMKGKFYEGK